MALQSGARALKRAFLSITSFARIQLMAKVARSAQRSENAQTQAKRTCRREGSESVAERLERLETGALPSAGNHGYRKPDQTSKVPKRDDNH